MTSHWEKFKILVEVKEVILLLHCAEGVGLVDLRADHIL